MAETKRPHGGARRGAGRPVGTKKPENERRETLPVRLTAAERAKAERIGNGVAARGVRRALSTYEG